MTLRHALCLVTIGLLIGLAACAQQGNRPEAVPAAAPQTQFTYTTLAEVSQADAPGAVAAAKKSFKPRSATGKSEAKSRDDRAIATFQYYFVHAVQAAKPRRTNMIGSGATLGDALVKRDVEQRLELQVAMDDVLARYPDRHDVSGALLRSRDPKKSRYALQVTFRANGVTRTLYYDMTVWVEYTQKHG